MLLPGEKIVIKKMLEQAEIYGYGNFIAHLKREWIKKLIDSGFDERTAEKSADVNPYPQNFNF